ncbi:MAG: phenylalanine--tRNA ligase subunit beta [Proteobacteria bacterium]|nr:phenylalanine--tRNA ligase subunit beta [Pseudomonadota bacterium]MDA0926902.1 phenylalanine--tRNA ligase subunit beta [Pseudomonadota bacterium]
MIICESWLREWVNPDFTTEELMTRLTMAGLEVDGVSAVAREFTGIVVAEVEAVEAHPDADKLRVCQVNDGSGVHQVVCGAPNVRAGMKAPFAQIGAEINTGEDKPFKIKAAKLRGVESSGMLCSAEELGLAESSDGLLELANDAPVGTDIRTYLSLDDASIEVDLTPNRGDCLSVAGIAREVGVIAKQDVTALDVAMVPATHQDEFPVKITAADECPRYLGRIIRNVNLGAETPLWMQEKLRRSGLRSIDPIVDVTNFVLMELGQPMHAFDFSKLEGGIEVRLAGDKEKITLLDGKEVEMNPDTLVIADASQPVAMAGIMGGQYTAVSDSTRDVFLECAYFAPLAIAGKARGYGMHTDASHRYERGVDHALQHRAMERATGLLLSIVGGEAGPVTEAVGNLPEQARVSLRYEQVGRQLGISMEKAEIKDIFARLGLQVLSDSESEIHLAVPSYRFDIAIEADLIEEIARIYGYDNIPLASGNNSTKFGRAPETKLDISQLRNHLVALGYQEIISYSFIDPALSDLVCGTATRPIRLQNPISEEMAVMRGSLLPGLLQTLQYNANRQHERLRLFETGLVFQKLGEETRQTARLGGLLSGRRNPKNWNNNNEISDFYDVKGDIESLLDLGANGAGFQFLATEAQGYHPGQCAEVRAADGSSIGVIGALHPSIQRAMGLDTVVYLFELDLAAVLAAEIPVASELSRYPEVSRDLALVIDESVSSGAISQLVRENAGEFLVGLQIFDVYQGDAVTKGKKSVALGLTWQHPSRTLSDEEINAIISSCINALQEQFNANLRN